MRIKTVGAAISAALATAAMLAIPATANAADKIDFNSGVKLSVSRTNDGSISAQIENPTTTILEFCSVAVADQDFITPLVNLTRRYGSDDPANLSAADRRKLEKAQRESKLLGSGYTLGIEGKLSFDIPLSMIRDDSNTKPEGAAICIDEEGDRLLTSTVGGGLIGSLDIGGSLAGNTESVSSLDFGGSLGL